MKKSTLLVLASYLLLSACYSWPAICLSPTILPTRHFDLYPALWLLQEAPSTFPNLLHQSSAWPYGESLARIDSYFLLWIGWLNQNFLSALQIADLLMWLGPALNAMAAEFCAHRAFSIPRPYSWLAGLAFGFSGLSSLTLLEGHVYYLLNPWLPLLLWALWTGAGPYGRWYHGLYAGLFWALCQFTTAYLGICGALLIVGLFLRAPRLLLLPGLLVGALPPALYYLWLFSLGGTWKDNAPASQALQTGASTLSGLLHVSPLIDLGGHSIAAPLCFLSFWLWALAPWVLKNESGWKGLWGLSLVALLASFGATFRVVPGGDGIPSPLSLLHLPGLSLFRFPIRLLWLYQLLAGVLASKVLAARWNGGPAWMVLAVVDVFLSSGMPGRLPQGIAGVPSAYLSAPPDRAVLDIYGEALDPTSGELEMRARALSCYYQSLHHRPIPEVCIGTGIQSPREVLSRWLVRELSRADQKSGSTLKILEETGIGSVALHLDTLRPADAKILENGLRSLLGPPVAETKDAGERLQIFSLSSTQYDVLKARQWMKGLDGP